MPDGQDVDFGDRSYEEIRAMVEPKFPELFKDDPQGGPLRPMGVGLRNVIEGATSFLDIPANFVAGVGNLGVLGADALSEAITGEESDIDQYARFTGIRPLVSSSLDASGVPTAQNTTEKVIGSGIEAGTAALTGAGTGSAIKQGINVTANAVRSALSDVTRSYCTLREPYRGCCCWPSWWSTCRYWRKTCARHSSTR